MRILLAEDNPVNQGVACAVLARQGHTVVVAHNGREALARVQAERFDLVLMDVQMPEMDGLDATRAIREIEAGTGAHLPIIGVTAHAMKGDRERCLGAGMDGYVSKPLRAAALFAAIDEAVGRPAAANGQSASQDVPILDEAGLVALASSDGQFIRTLADLFRKDSPKRLAEIRDALDRGDLPGVQRAAHALKGSAGSLWGLRTAETALRLEGFADGGDLARARACSLELSEDVTRLQQALTGLAGRYLTKEKAK